MNFGLHDLPLFALTVLVLKGLGAAYLVWLAVGMLRSALATPTARDTEAGTAAPVPLGRVFRQGLLTNVLNPKVALFFLAFLPQFIDADASHKTLSFLALGGWFVLQSALFLAALVLLTARLRHLGRGSATSGRWLNGLGGVLFLGLAAKLARTDLP
jgi:threonine/homoserine/homoserine lactone efflux protein